MWAAYWDAFLDIWCDMAPWLLVGFGVAFLCSYGLSERWMRRHLGGAGWRPIVKASIFGLPLPICSCGVLLVGLALKRNGARKAPVCAFLASTPQSGTDAILVSLPLLGGAYTALRFVGAILSGLLAGALVRLFGAKRAPESSADDLGSDCAAVCACHHHDPDHPHHAGEEHHHEFTDRRTRLREAAWYAFVHLPGEVAVLLLIGVAVAAGLMLFLPENVLQGLPLPMAYALAVLVGLPTYACSLAMVPIAAGLIAGGLSPGAAFVFLACAPTTHLGALLVLGKELGVRTTLCFVLGIVLVAVGMGLLIDFPLASWISIPPFSGHAEHEHAEGLGWLTLLPLALLLVHGWWQVTHGKHAHAHGSEK